MAAAAALLAWDGALYGTCLLAWIICPIWFLVSLVNLASKHSGGRLAWLRPGIPAIVLGLLWANSIVQRGVGAANGQRIVAACEAFRAANGRFPETLDELVPQYLSSVPRAKYCLTGHFAYYPATPILSWQVTPPHLRRVYNFETRTWSDLD